MITVLKKIFEQSDHNDSDHIDNLYILCGLMLEAANIDGVLDDREIKKISQVLIEVFNEDSSEVEIILKKCLNDLDNPKSLHYFTSKINKSFSFEKKLTLIEVLWQIILEDGKVHDFESNLIRRLAGLLYISDVDCGKAKKKILNEINNEDQ